MSIIRLFWPNKKFSLVLGRYTEIPYRYPIFWNIDTDADVGIRNTENTEYRQLNTKNTGSVFASSDWELYSYYY